MRSTYNDVMIGLILLGTMQIIGDLTGVKVVQAVGQAITASPAPKVFTTANGLETFSSRFNLKWLDMNGEIQTVHLTPAVYSQMKGPYNRRNVYGAVMAYGPILIANPRTRTMFQSVSQYAFCGDAPILAEFGIDRSDIHSPLFVEIIPKATTNVSKDLSLSHYITCNE